jgi:hypothetical protein
MPDEKTEPFGPLARHRRAMPYRFGPIWTKEEPCLFQTTSRALRFIIPLRSTSTRQPATFFRKGARSEKRSQKSIGTWHSRKGWAPNTGERDNLTIKRLARLHLFRTGTTCSLTCGIFVVGWIIGTLGIQRELVGARVTGRGTDGSIPSLSEASAAIPISPSAHNVQRRYARHWRWT